jgi:hypothetical protein
MLLLERARATLRARLAGRAPGSLPAAEASALLDLALLAGDAPIAGELRAAALAAPPAAAAAAAAEAPPPPPPAVPPPAAVAPLLRQRASALQRALLLQPAAGSPAGGGAAAPPPPPRRRSELLRDVFSLVGELREGGLAMNDALAAGNLELDGTGKTVEGNAAAVERAGAALQREHGRAWRHACTLCGILTWGVLAFFVAYAAIRLLPRPPRAAAVAAAGAPPAKAAAAPPPPPQPPALPPGGAEEPRVSYLVEPTAGVFASAGEGLPAGAEGGSAQ